MKKIVSYSLFTLVLFLLSFDLQASNIEKCSTRTNQDGLTRSFCIIKIDQGKVGDRVTVLNPYAINIAQGRIISRKLNSPYAVILLSNINEQIRKNYPVIVEFSLSDESIKSSRNSKPIMYSRIDIIPSAL